MTDLIDFETISELTREMWLAFVPEGGSLIEGVADYAPGREDVAGSVEISGRWQGTVELTCTLAAARRVAAAMFAVEEAAVDDLAVRDAIGELANVVGGNVKSLLPTPTELSLPRVVEGADVATPPPASVVCEAAFDWLGEPLVVRVWQPEGATAAS